MLSRFGEATLLEDCFIIPKIHCLHHAQVCINTNKKIKQRLVEFPDHIWTDYDLKEQCLVSKYLSLLVFVPPPS